MNTKNEKLNEFDDIVEVKEFHLIQDVNAHLKLGWKLLDTYKTLSANKKQVVKYCMGWPKSAAVKKQALLKEANNKALAQKRKNISINKAKQTSGKEAKKFVYSL